MRTYPSIDKWDEPKIILFSGLIGTLNIVCIYSSTQESKNAKVPRINASIEEHAFRTNERVAVIGVDSLVAN